MTANKTGILIVAVLIALVGIIFALRPPMTEGEIHASDAIKARPSGRDSIPSGTAQSQKKAVAATSYTDALDTLRGAETQPTFHDALIKRSPAEKEYLRTFNDRFFGILEYRNLEELAWKQSRLFPSLDEILKMRGKPVPKYLTFDEVKTMSPNAIARYLTQIAVSMHERKTLLADDQDANLNFVLYMSVGPAIAMQREMDTPLNDYLLAGSVDTTWKGASTVIPNAAVSAAAKGDGMLALAILDKRDPNLKTAEAVLGAALQAANTIQTNQFQCGADRFQGNPREIVELRKAFERKC